MKRYALVTGRDLTAEKVAAYLPGNYRVEGDTSLGIVVGGRDDHGWTLHGYVLPRLGSGLMMAVEIDLSHPAMKEVPL